MKFINSILISVLTVSIIGLSVNAWSADTKTVTFNIKARFTAPSCDLSYAQHAAVQLGILTPGTATKHTPLTFKWTCANNIPVKTALTGRVSQGQLESDQAKVQMVNTRDNFKPNGTFLWLEHNGTPIKLTGKDAFCSDSTATTGERLCVITPVTEVHNTDQFGPVKATVTFEVIYP
ncbi:TPA: fimbrial protein [Escherichia coli]|uniref:fimbrial protein n=1 Tax=Escherichia coli TaxID=562 RepID=UPI000BDF0C7A|nr:fimbrial protein [Escherichia coli]EFN6768037.1 fimbrial protein [Escherichia coli O39:H21]EEZ6938436.1 fimbrial protein [Escherichia coli]EFA4871015.1 fimbrial protein [Escherichia coli]EFA4897649.1 fimbrial protein [Escherichia coli]EFB9808702.1 fimbrial protein [Escherichia coli]